MAFNVFNETPDQGQATKWDLTKPALISSAEKMPETLAVGMSFFPNVLEMMPECIHNVAIVPIELMSGAQRERINTALGAVVPIGATPTHDAWLFGRSTVEASLLGGPKAVAIVTDGAPNYGKDCSMQPDIAALVEAVAAAFATNGTLTFVVGSPGSQGGGMQEDGRPGLSRMAEAGGTAPRDGTGTVMCSHAGPNYCHFDVSDKTADFGGALIEALDSIVNQVQKCN